jgi:hypothetical protein
MMYIDLAKLDTSKIVWFDRWQKKTNAILDKIEKASSIKERNEIIDKNQRYWSIFKDELKKISYNKCWYSETRNPYSYLHVDHFRPKKRVEDIYEIAIKIRDGYWWLVFDYTNFRLSGSVGNSKKSDHFAVKHNKVESKGSISDEVYYFLDPTVKEDVALLNFDNEGKAVPSVPEKFGKWNFDRAKYSIDFMDLNYGELKDERKLKWQEVSILINNVNDAEIEYNIAPTITNKSKRDIDKDKIRMLLKPDQVLTCVVKRCLRASGQDWAYNLLEENIIV